MGIDKLPIKKQEVRKSELEIRRAEIEDYETVSYLVNMEMDFHHRARQDYFKVQTIGYSFDEFQELLELPCPMAWLAVNDGQVVGLCFGKIAQSPESFFCRTRKVAFIEDLVTLPKYRGQGVATALMARARKQALAEGAETLELCVWNFNENALRLYERMGMSVQYYRMEEKLEDN